MKKSKWDILGKDIDKENSQFIDSWFYYWYDGEDCFNYDYGNYYTYNYNRPVYEEYISKRGSKWTKHQYMVGNYIDMSSIYDKQTMRQKKIDFLLGIEDEVSKPTIGDIIKKL